MWSFFFRFHFALLPFLCAFSLPSVSSLSPRFGLGLTQHLCSTMARVRRAQRWRCSERLEILHRTHSKKKKNRNLKFSALPAIRSAFPWHGASEGQRTAVVLQLRTWFVSVLDSHNSFASLYPWTTKIPSIIYWPRVKFRMTAIFIVYVFFSGLLNCIFLFLQNVGWPVVFRFAQYKDHNQRYIGYMDMDIQYIHVSRYL